MLFTISFISVLLFLDFVESDPSCLVLMAILQVRVNTRLLYQQTKFNLLREESEGYSKLVYFYSTSLVTCLLVNFCCQMEVSAFLGFIQARDLYKLVTKSDQYPLQVAVRMDMGKASSECCPVLNVGRTGEHVSVTDLRFLEKKVLGFSVSVSAQLIKYGNCVPAV